VRTRRRAVITWMSLAATVLIMTTGCGTNSSPSASVQTTDLFRGVATTATTLPTDVATTEAAVTTPATTATVPTTLPGLSGITSASFAVKDSSTGYSATVSIQWGPARRPTPQDVADTAGSQTDEYRCGLNPQTDLVIPFTLRMTNTTNGFDLINAGIQINLPPYGEGATYPGFIYAYFQSTCGISAQLNDSSIAPDTTVYDTGIVEVQGYYSPADPTGDFSQLKDITLPIETSLPWVMSDPSSGLLPYNDDIDTGGLTFPLIPLWPGSNPSCQAAEWC